MLGPCQKPAAGWVLRLRCSQAFAAIALVPATACAQTQARRRYSLQTPRSPFQATLPSRSPSKSGDPERKLSSINLQLLFLCPLVAAAPERSDTAFLFSSCFERAADDTLRFLVTSPGSAPLRPTFLALDAADRPLEHPPQPPHHRKSGHSTATVAAETPCRPLGLFGVYLCFRCERMLDCDFTCRTDSTA